DALIELDWLLVDADQGLSVGAIENVDPAGLAGLGDAQAPLAVVDLIEQHDRRGTIEVPQIVMHLLEVPGVFALERHRHDRGREQVVAGAVAPHAAGFRPGIAGQRRGEPGGGDAPGASASPRRRRPPGLAPVWDGDRRAAAGCRSRFPPAPARSKTATSPDRSWRRGRTRIRARSGPRP